MKLSDYVIEFLIDHHINHIFEVIGGAIVHLLDSTYDRDEIRCVSMHHEQGAAFAAEGYARTNGKLGVAMATSGPGATNLVTGIGSCYFDSIPVLFITGQVNTYEYKWNRQVRQVGFQETDIVSIVRPITKYASLVSEARRIRYELEKAAFIAQAGRPGPCLLDIPMDVQRVDIDPESLEPFLGSEEHERLFEQPDHDRSLLDKICELLLQAKRPLLLVGGGVRSAGAVQDLHQFVARTGLPAVSSLLGLDAIPGDHPAFLGMIGAYGNRHSNITLANCDFLLVLGSRLDTRQTGTNPETFCREATIVHVDIDPQEINQRIRAHLPVLADVKVFLQAINQRQLSLSPMQLAPWLTWIQRCKSRFSSFMPAAPDDPIHPNEFLALLSHHVAEEAIIAVDTGQHQMWAAQAFGIRGRQRMLFAGGMGAMGFGLPAAIGAAFAAPDRPIVLIAGDGGFQMNIQELQVIVSNHLPIKLVVLNNYALGMVRQFQQHYFENRTQSTVAAQGYNVPNLKAVVNAYGISGASITRSSESKAAIRSLLTERGPAFLEVNIPVNLNVEPKLPVNHPIEDQYPYLDDQELASWMLIPMVSNRIEKVRFSE